jgi:Domain of unknown function (DUF4917)
MGKFGLADWQEQHHRALLLGNGSSVAISSRFRYGSLLDAAGLTGDDLALFEHLRTVDFEEALHCLHAAQFVAGQTGGATQPIADRYSDLRQKLVNAVDAHHVSRAAALRYGVLQAWNVELMKYTSIFSTNYDLLLYWSINQKSDQFVDFVFAGGFDEGNCLPFGPKRQVWWLHGGLHLYVDSATGEVRKHVSTSTGSIQSLFSNAGTRSLFIAEGSSRQKRSRIRSNSYLETAYQRLRDNHHELVVLGSQLGPTDVHLVDAINNSSCPCVLIGIYPSDQHRVTEERGRLGGLFSSKKTEFFDSETHPLTDPKLNIP